VVKLNIIKPESFTQYVLLKIAGYQNSVAVPLVEENNVKPKDTR